MQQALPPTAQGAAAKAACAPAAARASPAQRPAQRPCCRASAAEVAEAQRQTTRLRPHETADQAFKRRVRESERVDERVEIISTLDEFKARLRGAGDQLVVLEVESPEVCDTGLSEEAEAHWKEDKQARLARCDGLKHVLQRTARDSPDVTFLTLEAGTPEGAEACDALGVDVLPTLQFWKGGEMLWEHRGVLQLEQDLGEGVLYYGDQAANGLRPSTYVQDLKSRADLDDFVSSQAEKVLNVVFVASATASSCVHIFAAVLALARSFQGYARFGRLEYDGVAMGGEGRAMAEKMNVMEVPTFVFFRNGREVGRHVGSSRADLIGKILQVQNALGIAPPPPPAKDGVPRQKQARARRNAWG